MIKCVISILQTANMLSVIWGCAAMVLWHFSPIYKLLEYIIVTQKSRNFDTSYLEQTLSNLTCLKSLKKVFPRT